MRQSVRRIPALVALWVLWVALWGEPTPLVLLGGVPVVTVVALVFPLPPLRERIGLRPWPLAVLIGHLLADLVTSSLTVAAAALRPDVRGIEGALVEVPLRVDTDLLIALTANIVSLTPGSIVVEIDRERAVLTVHTFPARPDGPDTTRAAVRAVERRVARAFGPADALHTVEESP